VAKTYRDVSTSGGGNCFHCRIIRSDSSLTTVQKRVRTKALFVSRFSPDVSLAGVEQSLKVQLELAFLTSTKLKTKLNSYSSFHISVSQGDFHLITNTGV
jgi:hypothetical protein